MVIGEILLTKNFNKHSEEKVRKWIIIYIECESLRKYYGPKNVDDIKNALWESKCLEILVWTPENPFHLD